MSAITILVLFFAILGAIDKLLGDKFGLGKEFERGFNLFTPMVLSMLGILVLAPAAGVWLAPVFDGFYAIFHLDPSIIPAALFANDMGGMTLSQTVCKDPAVGGFNAFVVSSMLGCTISFTIPLPSAWSNLPSTGSYSLDCCVASSLFLQAALWQDCCAVCRQLLFFWIFCR